jgi:hypothetical protein
MRGRRGLLLVIALLIVAGGGWASLSFLKLGSGKPAATPAQVALVSAPSAVTDASSARAAAVVAAAAQAVETPMAAASLPAIPVPPAEPFTPSPEPAGPSAAEIAEKEAIRASYAAAPDIIWGVNGHPFTGYPDIGMEVQLDTLKRLGMTHYRVNLRGDGSVLGLDRLLGLAEKRGISIVPIILPEISFEKDTPDKIYGIAYALGRRLAKRYAGRVKVWELGNEFENYAIIQPCEMRDDGTKYPCEWGPAGGVGPLEYYGPRWRKVSAALRGLSDGVRAGDPVALRALGTAGWGHLGAFDRMAQDGVQWDISVWHQYQPGNDDFMKHIASFGKPIWVTEFNYAGGSTDGEAAQAKGLSEMMTRHREIRAPFRVEAVFVYELFDEPYWSGYEAQMGLIHLKKNGRGFWEIGEPKQAYEVVRALIAQGAQGLVPPSLR